MSRPTVFGWQWWLTSTSASVMAGAVYGRTGFGAWVGYAVVVLIVMRVCFEGKELRS